MIKIGEHSFDWSSSRQSFVCRAAGGDCCAMTVAAADAKFDFKGTKICCGNEDFAHHSRDIFKCKNCNVEKSVGTLAPHFTLEIGAKVDGVAIPATAADYRKAMEQIEKQQANIDVLYGSVGMNSEGELNDKLSQNGIEFNCTKYNKVKIGDKDFMTIAISIAKKGADEKRVIKYGLDEQLAKYVTQACTDMKVEIVKRAIEHAKIDIQSRSEEAKRAILYMEEQLANARKLLGMEIPAAPAPAVVAEKPKRGRKAKEEPAVEAKVEAKVEAAPVAIGTVAVVATEAVG